MSAHFNPPPGWRTPPEPGWKPPQGWEPDPSWPPAPTGWGFWVDDSGLPTRGPHGLYGGEASKQRAMRFGLVGALCLAVFTACTSLLSGGTKEASVAAPPVVTPTATVTMTVTQTATQTVTATALVTVSAPAPPPAATPSAAPVPLSQPVPAEKPAPPAPASRYFANCAAARAAGAAPLHRGDPGYRSGLDRDRDGIACE